MISSSFNGMIICYPIGKKENENFQNSNVIAYTQFLETSPTFKTHLRRRKIIKFGNSNIDSFEFVESANAFYVLLNLTLLKGAEIIAFNMK